MAGKVWPDGGRPSGRGEQVLGVLDQTHGVVEGKPQDFGEEVDGVSGEIPLGPAPVIFFDQESWIGAQMEVSSGELFQGQSAFGEDGEQGGQSRGPDLLTIPARLGSAGVRGGVGHSLSSSGVV